MESVPKAALRGREEVGELLAVDPTLLILLLLLFLIATGELVGHPLSLGELGLWEAVRRKIKEEEGREPSSISAFSLAGSEGAGAGAEGAGAAAAFLASSRRFTSASFSAAMSRWS